MFGVLVCLFTEGLTNIEDFQCLKGECSVCWNSCHLLKRRG